MSILISTWACCPPLRHPGSENKQSSKRLSVSWESGFCWAGCTKRKKRTSTRVDTVSFPLQNGDTVNIILSQWQARAKSMSPEETSSGWQRCWDFCWIYSLCVWWLDKSTGDGPQVLRGLSVLLSAAWGQEAVLEHLACGAAGGIFEQQGAKESSRCCSWSSYWGWVLLNQNGIHAMAFTKIYTLKQPAALP